MTRLKYTYYLFMLLILMLFSCTKSYELDHELNEGISIEAYVTPYSFASRIWSNFDYPCTTELCKPLILDDLTLILTDNEGEEHEIAATDGSYFKIFDEPKKPGDIIGIKYIHDGKWYRSIARIPDELTSIDAASYFSSGDNPGLVLRLNRDAMNRANAIYVQMHVASKELFSYFGYLIHNDPARFDILPRNGSYVNEEFYYIPQSTIEFGGLNIESNDTISVTASHLSPESTIFFEEFKWQVINSELGISNNQLTFAPSNPLPSNFIGEAYGFFHASSDQNFFIVAQ